MPLEAPSVIVLAGPNGAGKSTMAANLVTEISDVAPFAAPFVDADVIARELSRSPSRLQPIAAGRAMLRRLDELAGENRSFGFETTLASRTFAPRIGDLIARGYEFHLVFLWLPSPDLAVARVAQRVRVGGHDVPEATIRRRYRSGLRNFFELYRPLTTAWRMYDNALGRPRLIASGAKARVLSVNDPESWNRILVEVERDD